MGYLLRFRTTFLLFPGHLAAFGSYSKAPSLIVRVGSVLTTPWSPRGLKTWRPRKKPAVAEFRDRGMIVFFSSVQIMAEITTNAVGRCLTTSVFALLLVYSACRESENKETFCQQRRVRGFNRQNYARATASGNGARRRHGNHLPATLIEKQGDGIVLKRLIPGAWKFAR